MIINEEYFLEMIPIKEVRRSIVKSLSGVKDTALLDNVSIQFGVGKFAIFKMVGDAEYQFLGIIG
jgi:hypothetical protein